MRKGYLWVLLLGLAQTLPALAAGVKFLGPPRVSDRRVEWKWVAFRSESEELPSDPFYTANSTMKRVGFVFQQPLHDRQVAALLLDATGTKGFSISADGQQVFGWDLEAGVPSDTLAPLPPGVTVLAASLHPLEMGLAVALADGRVAVWDLDRPDTVWVFQAHVGRCNDIMYVPGVLEQRFLTAGEDGKILEWAVDLEPDMPEPVPARSFSFTEGEATRLGMDQGRKVLVGGSSLGELRFWNFSGGNLVGVGNMSVSPVTSIAIGSQGKLMATANEAGSIVIWDFQRRQQLVEMDPEFHGSPSLAFTPPDDRLLIVAYQDGTIEVRDGRSGKAYRSGQEGMTLTAFAPHPDGSRSLVAREDGRIVLWRAGTCRPSPDDPVCFGGYRVFRGKAPTREALVLLRTYSYGDSSWTFSSEDSIRYFVDPDSVLPRGADPEVDVAGPHNGIPYYYAVAQFNRRYLAGSVFEVYVCDEQEDCVVKGLYRDPETGEPLAVIPRRDPRTESPVLGRVRVVPNPYEKGKVVWDDLSYPHVRFINLPARAEIRIYTVAGDLVRVIQHGKDPLGQDSGEEDWDLKNGAGERVASGVYVYTVRTPDGRHTRGYLTLIF
jgi:WD40 repeat protein